MAETHRTEFDYFDFKVEVDDEGGIKVMFVPMNGDALGMDWETFLECVYFAAKHGKDMELPTLVPFTWTTEGQESS